MAFLFSFTSLLLSILAKTHLQASVMLSWPHPKGKRFPYYQVCINALIYCLGTVRKVQRGLARIKGGMLFVHDKSGGSRKEKYQHIKNNYEEPLPHHPLLTPEVNGHAQNCPNRDFFGDWLNTVSFPSVYQKMESWFSHPTPFYTLQPVFYYKFKVYIPPSPHLPWKLWKWKQDN